MAESDAALVARVVADDDRIAFELLVRRYQSPLRNFLRRLTRTDPDRADDLAQDTFLKVYSAIDSFRGTSKFSTWLYRIAYNTFLNDERKERRDMEFDESLHSPAADTSPSSSEADNLDRALGRLGDRQRAIFDLHYRKGMTHYEVASVLEVPLGTVKSDLRRGLDELRAALKITEQD